MRDRIQQLQQHLHEAETLLDALRSEAKTTATAGDLSGYIIESLRRGDSRASIIGTVTGFHENNNNNNPLHPTDDDTVTLGLSSGLYSTRNPTSETSSSSSPSAGPTPDSQHARPSSSDQIPPYALKTDAGASGSPAYPVTTSSDGVVAQHLVPAFGAEADASLPDFRGQRDFSDSQSTALNTTRWMKSRAWELVSPVLSWDAIPLCVVNKEQFKSDFSSQRQFCSPALSSTLLALAAKLRGQESRWGQHGQGSSLGQETPREEGLNTTSGFFLQESGACLWNDKKSVLSLPDIQAIGVLALYYANFGDDSKAQALADEYVVAIADLCLSEPAPEPGSDYCNVRIDTYRGAVILQRFVCPSTSSKCRHQACLLYEYVSTMENRMEVDYVS